MYVIAGLGNPGRKYAHTRHNMGFMALDRIADEMGIEIRKKKFDARVGEGSFSGQKVILVKPLTYMNLSGHSLVQVTAYYGIDPDHLIVIYDDIDIDSGAVRIRKKGGPGTHNGMKSVVGMMGTGDFPRIRIGVGDERSSDLKDYVIGKISREEKERLDDAVARAARAAESIINDGIDNAMNRFNGNS